MGPRKSTSLRRLKNPWKPRGRSRGIVEVIPDPNDLTGGCTATKLILAIDLGKFKGVTRRYDPEPRNARIPTDPEPLRAAIQHIDPQLVGFEARALGGRLADFRGK